MNAATGCAVVIPALDEIATIRRVAEDALAHCARVIVIDDGSRDGTGEAIGDLPVTLLRHDTPRGKGEALKAGFTEALHHADVGAVITMDGDGQHAAADIPRLLVAARRHPDALLLCHRRIGRARQPLARRMANHIADFWIGWAAGMAVSDTQCGHRLYPRALLEALPPAAMHGGFVFESEVLIDAARAGFPIASVEIEARYESGRRASHFRPWRDISRITNMVFWKIVRHGFYLPGLVRSLTSRPLKIDA